MIDPFDKLRVNFRILCTKHDTVITVEQVTPTVLRRVTDVCTDQDPRPCGPADWTVVARTPDPEEQA